MEHPTYTPNTAVQPSRNNLVPREGMQWSRPSSSLPLMDKHCAVPSKYPLYEVLAGQAEYAQVCICNHPSSRASQASQASQARAEPRLGLPQQWMRPGKTKELPLDLFSLFPLLL